MSALQQHTGAPEVSAALEGLRQKFIDSLYDRVIEIEGLLVELRAQGPSDRLLGAVAARLHKLAGVAPTLGFNQLGRDARSLEQFVDRIVQQGYPAGTFQRAVAGIDRFLDLLEQAIDEQSAAEMTHPQE